MAYAVCIFGFAMSKASRVVKEITTIIDSGNIDPTRNFLRIGICILTDFVCLVRIFERVLYAIFRFARLKSYPHTATDVRRMQTRFLLISRNGCRKPRKRPNFVVTTLTTNLKKPQSDRKTTDMARAKTRENTPKISRKTRGFLIHMVILTFFC